MPNLLIRRLRPLTQLALVLGFVGLAGDAAAEGVAGLLAGFVRGGSAEPVGAALVFAHNLAEAQSRQVRTDPAGRFQFSSLPAGVYTVVAFKSGFLPAVVGLTRPSGDRSQTLDLHLLPDPGDDPRDAEDYWEMRSRIPADILREIEAVKSLESAAPGSQLGESLSRFEADVMAQTGVDDIVALGRSQLTGGQLSVQGELGGLKLGLQGDFWRLQPTDESSVTGSSNAVALDVESRGDARLLLSTSSNRLVARESGAVAPVDFEQVRLAYSQPLGENGSSAFAAQMVDESNFHRPGLAEPLGLPESSRTWEVEGSYSKEINDRSTVATGLRYRERQAYPGFDLPASAFARQAAERVDLFGQGDYRVRPALLVEYGVYTVLQDGDLALAPQGGLVLQINPLWQAVGRVSGRVSEVDPRRKQWASDFAPARHQTAEAACMQGDELCYQLQLLHRNGDDSLSVGAVHREFGETLRLYFSDDFFDRQESVYLVPGDRLPELQVSLTHRISPTILAKLESSYASGGGGTFYATSKDAYENEVRYLITSLDAQFQTTSTGVFLAFHQIEQNLLPKANAAKLDGLASERLELKVSQDLNVLLDLPADWALQLNMELSRGNPASEGRDEVRRRVLGGIQIKF